MSDSNSSTSEKKYLCKDQGLKFSVPWQTTETEKADLSERNDSGFAEPMISRKFEDPISPGTEVCASALPEDSSFSDSNFVNDPVMCHDDSPISNLNSQLSKYRVSDEQDKALFVNKTNFTKSRAQESPPNKCNSDKLNTSINCKNKSSTNFSIFGQLLNKKQNNVAGSRDSCSSNNYSVSQSSSYNVPKSDGADMNESTQRPQMKTKLKSFWNNVKYGWRMKREVNLKIDRATWILGQCYHSKLNEDVSFIQDVSEQLRLDLLSKIWLTYRINFPTIPGTTLITDSGWGCMLRCGQMMMAQAFVCHFLQRDWRVSSQPADQNQVYKNILRWFGDSLSDNSPFSIHHLVSMGENYGRKAGDWYGPTHVAHVLRDALGKAKEHHPQLQQLCMYVASDGIVFKQDVMDLCLNTNDEKTQPTSDFETLSMTELQNKPVDDFTKDNESADFVKVDPRIGEDFQSSDDPCLSYSEFGPPSYNSVHPTWKSLILFVSVRLGNDKINPFYIPCLKSLLAYENCIGIIGGRPKHALYFIGWQDDKIIHMDPHSCQQAIDVEKEDFIEKSFHSSSVRMMSFSDMDPSCSIGFYFREFEDFQIFIEKFSEITAPLKRNLEYPVFALADGKRIEIEGPSYLEEKDSYPPLRTDYDDINDDDYILL